MKKLRLKRLGKDEEYLPDQCAVVKCSSPSKIIDGTHKLASVNVPLCDYHWDMRASSEEEKE